MKRLRGFRAYSPFNHFAPVASRTTKTQSACQCTPLPNQRYPRRVGSFAAELDEQARLTEQREVNAGMRATFAAVNSTLRIAGRDPWTGGAAQAHAARKSTGFRRPTS